MPDTRDIKNIRSRLERWELTHLRAHAAALHEQLETANLRAAQAESWAASCQREAEALQDDIRQFADAAGVDVGLTQSGALVPLARNVGQGPIAFPTLQPGEHYAGIEVDADDKPLAHIILMDQRLDKDLTWQDAMGWAASVGGSLPTRQQLALLFANCKAHVSKAWHWSCETHEEDPSYAWICHFNYGNQLITHKSYEGCAVAVRRLPLESFNPLDSAAQGAAA